MMEARLPPAWVGALDFDQAHIWHPYASMSDTPLNYPVVGAAGVRLELADGRYLIDGLSSWWAAIHGYNHPRLNSALTAQIPRLAHVMFGGLTHEPAIALARRLSGLVAPGLDRVFFADSGSVAVEVAIKMAVQYWQARGRPAKHRLLALSGAYHGDTLAAMSVSDQVTGMHHLFQGVVPSQVFAPRPRCRFGDPWDPTDIARLEELMVAHKHELAAVIVEPIVQGAGGMWFYAPEYLQVLRALCTAHDVLLIIDEIATGFGRTGALFGSAHAAVAADIACVGKALTGGYMTLAATITTAEVAAVISTTNVLLHGPTFMANPLACAVAAASIDLLLESPWSLQVAAIEAQLKRELAPCARLSTVKEVRVLGAIGVVEMHEAVDVPAFCAAAIDAGVWLRPFGRLVYLMPPYVIGAEDLSILTAAVWRLLAAHADGASTR
ncbi:MAG: adenosylmethionine--8-amino-7-oxononanoate transaminase [Acidiferrobacter sp.]